MSTQRTLSVAVIDMNNGFPNQGMRGIQEALNTYGTDVSGLSYQVFDLRKKGEIPDLSFDAYISSGGPGSPYEGEGEKWENDFFDLLEEIDQWNESESEESKKFVFLICHSFQLACRKYRLGNVIPRKSNAFGIFPISLNEAGKTEPLFEGLIQPFYAVDSRDWQVIQPHERDFLKKGAQILAIEKERPHIALERCLMAIRFSPYMIGTQFHPEADATGMKMYLLQQDKKESIIKNHGEAKYLDMLNSLDDPQRISLTQHTILPAFLDQAFHNQPIQDIHYDR